MRRDGVTEWDNSEEFLLDSAEERFGRGDYFGALTSLNRRARSFPPSADSYALYADVYESMDLWDLAADAWFRFLDVCNEADFQEGYEGLAVCYMNMGKDLLSAFYYYRAYAQDAEEDGMPSPPPEEEVREIDETTPGPRIHLVGGGTEIMREGLVLLKMGNLQEARERLAEIEESSPDYPSAAGLSAMCQLMMGDEAGAEAACRGLLEKFPDNIQLLTTYCAVLGAQERREEAREVARKLASLPAEGIDDLYRISSALCETGLDEDAVRVLKKLKEHIRYDVNILYFYAVACFRTGALDEAIATLETLTTIYPSKAVAQYYLEKMRKLRDGDGEKFTMGYYYRLPEAEYRRIGDLLLHAANPSFQGDIPDFSEVYRLAFDEMEGRDEKLQHLAVKVALKAHDDDFLRYVLLDCNVAFEMKQEIMAGLFTRNVEDSFGVIMFNLYTEVFTHKLDIEGRGAKEMLRAYAEVAAGPTLTNETNCAKLCGAAEDIFRALSDARAWEYFDDKNALKAAIYREAWIVEGEHEAEEIASFFGTSRYAMQDILDFLM